MVLTRGVFDPFFWKLERVHGRGGSAPLTHRRDASRKDSFSDCLSVRFGSVASQRPSMQAMTWVSSNNAHTVRNYR